MKNSLDIIAELRVDCAALAGKIRAFSKIRSFNDKQGRLIEDAFKGLRFITVHHFCYLRRVYGDDNWQRLESIDVSNSPNNVSNVSRTVLTEIISDANGLQLKLLKMPGGNGCNNEQSEAINYLQMGFRFWRNVELELMKKEFEK